MPTVTDVKGSLKTVYRTPFSIPKEKRFDKLKLSIAKDSCKLLYSSNRVQAVWLGLR